MRDNRITAETIFSQIQERREVFTRKTKEKVTRAEAGKHLAQFHLLCELLKVIRWFSESAVPAEANSESAGSKVYYFPSSGPADDEDSFLYILHQQHTENK